MSANFQESEKHPVSLSASDASAFDSILDGGHTPADSARRQRAAEWLAVLDAAVPVEPPGDLVARTLARVQTEKPVGPASHRTQNSGPHRFTYFITSRRFAEMAAAAAAVMILFSVVLPSLSHARSQAKQAACAANLQQFGAAMNNYVGDSHMLPQLASMGDTWLPRLDVTAEGASSDPAVPADRHSNNANLIPLVRGSYAKPELLPCPAAGVSAARFDATRAVDIPEGIRGYSYVNLFGNVKPTWADGPTVVILADRNPLFGDHPVDDAEANSPNHNRQGNNVLLSNGAVQWMTTPNLAQPGAADDNIWTPCSYTTSRLKGTETIRSTNDSFASP